MWRKNGEGGQKQEALHFFRRSAKNGWQNDLKGECQFYKIKQAQDDSLCLLGKNFDTVFIFPYAAGDRGYIILFASY